MKIIDKNLFTNKSSPWPNQVFQQDFDAYFLLSYPPFQWQETEVFDPFMFMNNLEEDIIYANEINGTTKFNYRIPRGEYSFEDLPKYYNAFKSAFSNESYLLWQGNNDRWAVVSDNINKVCVLACNWKDAFQVSLFFGKCLLSPKQFLQKTNCEKHEAIFMKNYAPAKVLTEGSIENPVWNKYYIQSHVNKENDKLFYWPQFEKLYHSTFKLLNFCKSLDLRADQAFNRRFFKNKQWYSSYSNAPVGGFQNYNLKNCEKLATKFLTDNKHLQLAFDGNKEASETLYIDSKKGLIEFFGFSICAHKEKQKQKFQVFDFYLNMCLHCHANKDEEHNQNFEFQFKENFVTQQEIEKYLEELETFCFIKKTHKIRMPKTSILYSNDKPLEVINIYDFVPKEVTKNHPIYNKNI